MMTQDQKATSENQFHRSLMLYVMVYGFLFLFYFMPYSNSSKCSVLSLRHTIFPHDITLFASCLSVYLNVQPYISVPTLCHNDIFS